VIGGLRQPHPGDEALGSALKRGEHQLTADALVLRSRIDRKHIDGGNRPHTAFRRGVSHGKLYRLEIGLSAANTVAGQPLVSSVQRAAEISSITLPARLVTCRAPSRIALAGALRYTR
jgi:hypothetical protein